MRRYRISSTFICRAAIRARIAVHTDVSRGIFVSAANNSLAGFRSFRVTRSSFIIRMAEKAIPDLACLNDECSEFGHVERERKTHQY
jgi:hypothetical protein